jgi:hypothetical protein
MKHNSKKYKSKKYNSKKRSNKRTKKYNTKKYNTKKYNTKKYNTKKYNTKKYNTKKYKSRKYRGGELTVKPFEMLEYPHGASSESQAALLVGKAKSQEQLEMNRIGGGETMEVPQFYSPGGIKTAYSATNLSADGNLANLIGEVDSTNDHFATNILGKD